MSTSRGGGRAARKKVETPGRTGVEFEAVQGLGGSSQETFSYDEVSSLSTVTPAAKRSGKGGGSKAVAKAKATAGGQEVGNGKRPDLVTTEEEEGGAAKRRKQRRQEQKQQQQESTATATRNAGACNDNGDAGDSAGGAAGNETERAAAGAGKGLRAGEAPVPAAESKSGEKRRRSRSSAGLAPAGKGAGKDRGQRARPARKVPPYPKVGIVVSGKANTLADALGEAIATEVQGLIRKRGQDAACKAAVHACVDVGKEIRRQAEDIATDLDPMPRLDLKGVRRIFEEERQRQQVRNNEEEGLWAAEEQRCLALVEVNKEAQAEVQESAAEDRDSSKASREQRQEQQHQQHQQHQHRPLDEEEGADAYPEGLGTAKRVSNQLLASTDDMILNAGAIGRCLQEMGAGVADAQETKDKLVRVFRQHTLRNYPHVDNPKAGIAAMLK